MKVRAKIKALGYGGSFVGEVIPLSAAPDPRAGKKVFIREVVPGEIVDVEITKEEPKFILGKATAMVSASPDRVVPPCPSFGVCGGCDLQHLELAAQRSAKTEMVRTMLAVQGKLSPTEGVSLLGTELGGLHYRRRIQLHLDRAGALGFYRAGTTAVVPIERCFLALEPINAAIEMLRPFVKALCAVVGGVIIERHGDDTVVILSIREEVNSRRQKTSIEATVRPVAAVFPNLVVRQRNETVVRYRQGSEIGALAGDDAVGHFSQVNAAANTVLVETVLRHIDGATITDLYAGAGNFALPLARTGRAVTAVELDPALVLSGTKLARTEGLDVRYVPLPCEKFVERHPLGDAVVLDPPRAGAKDVVSRFDPRVTQQVVYVSCDLPSLTRDLKILVERGYHFTQLFVVDMFPQTHHVETVAILRAASVGGRLKV